ncbi:MAG: metallophosphoesterase [Candidatus Thorarchaeota archaeon]
MTEKTFLRELIETPIKLSALGFDKTSEILKNAKKVFENETLLLEFNIQNGEKEVYVIGDIHGNLDTLLKIFEVIELNEPEFVIFLGDIVDRGSKQVECLLFILVLKILEPQRYYLLRGNHETLEMNQYYGFTQEFVKRFKDPNKFEEILAFYNVIPICATINNRILCLHGGIPQDKHILQKIRNMRTTDLDKIIHSISESFIQIMWNDPKVNLQGFKASFRGPGIKFFGEDVFDSFLKENNLEFLIRAHECFLEGYKWFFHNRLLSIFTSANYRGNFSPNPASYAVIRKNEIIPKIVKF